MKTAQMNELVEAPGSYFLIPLTQNYVARQLLIVRTSGAPLAITQPVLQAIRQMDSAVPVYNVMPLSRNLDGITGFLLFRLGAAVIGVYGVISYSTAQRSREIGIRMALGAQPARVISNILRQGAIIVGCGVAGGILIALLMAKLVGSFLVDVSPFDLTTYVGISAMLAAIALFASFLPARRASHIDPAVALRQE